MSFISNSLSGLRKLCSQLMQSTGKKKHSSSRNGCRRVRLELEPLETRELLSMAVGMNIPEVLDFNPAWTFTDVFQSSHDWFSHAYNTVTGQFIWGNSETNGGAVNVDEHGWPTSLNQWTNEQGQLMQQQLGTWMFYGLDGRYPGGIYRAEWEGTGTVTWDNDAEMIEQGVTATGLNYALLDVTPGNDGVYMRIAGMNADDPIRNVHVWMPDYNGQSFAGQVWTPGADFSPFHPLFLERLSPFTTIRFSEWSMVGTTDIQHWSERSQVDDARQTGLPSGATFQNGVALEYMIELANELNADPWFTMPHMADDDFVRNFATMVRDTLEPEQTIYVEWSNEIWNTIFEVDSWVSEQLLLPENAGLDRYEFMGREIQRDFAIWTEVFAGQEDRIVRVVAGWANYSSVTAQILENMNGAFDAVSSSAYVGFAARQATYLSVDSTPDQILDLLIQESLPRTLGFVQEHQALAEQYSAALGRDILFLAYEGGPHLDPRDRPWQQAFFDATLSPRMYDLYQELLHGLDGLGVDLFVNFQYVDRALPVPWGVFGALNYQDQPLSDAHKYRALVDYIAATTTPPTVQSVVINDGHVQRSMVTSVTVTFNGPVFIDEGAFSLVKNGAAGGEVVLLGYNPGTYSSLTLSFSGSLVEASGSLVDGDYLFTINASKVSAWAAGPSLDGDRDGQAGGDSIDAFFRLFGDGNGDGKVDRSDRKLFRHAFRKPAESSSYLWYFDFDADQQINRTDKVQFRSRLSNRLRNG